MRAGEGPRRAGLVAAVSLLVLVLLLAPAPARGAASEAAGVEIDLLPIVASAIDGELGGSLQLWARRGQDRLRLVGAALHFPDALTAAPFADRRNAAVALIYDRFLLAEGTGPWIGAGVEYWWNSIGLEAGTARGTWQTPVLTAGAGWIFQVWRGLYLNPWGALHVPLQNGEVQVGAERYQPKAIEGEVSLKIGWSFPPAP